MMSINMNITKHATGFPSNIASQRYGGHMFSIIAGSDTDNGNLVAVGDWAGLDKFEEKAVTNFEGKIVQKMTNGNWLVLVTDPGDATFVYTKPLTPYESPRELLSETAFYNAQGDIMRTYGLVKFDRFEVNDAAFTGTPEVGKNITGVTAKKMVLA